MRTIARAGMAVVLLLAVSTGFAKTPIATKGSAAPKNDPGTLVIVFKDGHRQSFNLSEIARVEFPGGTSGEAAADAGSSTLLPSRGRFIAKWEVGDGNGHNFFITLRDNGDAFRTIGDVHGKWIYVDGEARVTWDDGAKDAIRKVGARYQKFAYRSGKSFSDEPDNVTNARNPNLGPI